MTSKTIRKIEGIDKHGIRRTYAIVQRGKVYAGYIDGENGLC